MSAAVSPRREMRDAAPHLASLRLVRKAREAGEPDAPHLRSPAVREMRDEGGFALLAVLWIMVGVAALGVAVMLAGREAVHAARNRNDLEVARWQAEDCLERARAAVHEVLTLPEAGGMGRDAPSWATLDRAVAASPLVAEPRCDVRMRPLGARVDVNRTEPERLRTLFVAAGIPPASADSLADAVADWRDPDDIPRPLGAEAAWYRAQGRPPPRDGAFADPRELRRVRGWAAWPALDTLVDVEAARVPVNHAAPAVLASLPGFGTEAVARVLEMRWRGERIGELLVLDGALSPPARDAFRRGYAELVGVATPEPEAWIVEARGAVGAPPLTQVVQVRLVRAGRRAAVVRRKTWSE